MFKRHVGRCQPRLPDWKFSSGHGKGQMQGSGAVMGRKAALRQRDAGGRGASLKEKQHSLPAGVQRDEAL